MAYDLIVGASIKAKEHPVIVGRIDFDEYPVICSLLKKKDCYFLTRICDQFSDSSFSVENCEQARSQLCSMLPTDLSEKERELVHKLISVTSYAIIQGESLHGVAD